MAENDISMILVSITVRKPHVMPYCTNTIIGKKHNNIDLMFNVYYDGIIPIECHYPGSIRTRHQ